MDRRRVVAGSIANHEGRVAETLTDLRLDEFFRRLSSGAPTPGGGSASALAGAAGAALLHMVLELTAGRPGAPDDAILAELRGAATTWQSELLELVTRDAAAYDGVVTARRLPRDTDREAESRAVQLEAAVREATRVPLETVRRAVEVLELAARIAPVANRNAISDVGVAALLAGASARAAAMNVRINLPSLPPGDQLVSQAGDELERLLAVADEQERTVRAAVEERLA